MNVQYFELCTMMQVKFKHDNTFFIPFAGHFGNGVLSFFIFLKWLLFLNVVIFTLEFALISLPSIIINSNITSQANTNSCNFDEFRIDTSSRSTADQVIDFVTGQVSKKCASSYGVGHCFIKDWVRRGKGRPKVVI